MRFLSQILISLVLCGGAVSAQNTTFTITGTAIPAELLALNYGKLPKGVVGYDLNICNGSPTKQPIVSSEIYQAMSQSTVGLQPIGRQIMLASVLRNQNRSTSTLVSVILNSVTGVLSVLSSSRYSVPTGLVTGAALGTISAQQIFSNLKPVLTSDQVSKFENEVLEPALVLDSGSCVERTMFASSIAPSQAAHSLKFHVR